MPGRGGGFAWAVAFVLALAAWLAGGAAAWAQIVDPLSEAPVVDRDRLDRREPELPRGPAVPELPRQVAPPTVPQLSAAAGTVSSVYVQGSTLDRAMLAEATAPMRGRPITRETLQDIANAVSTAYGESDVAFFSVSIPSQVPLGGRVLVKVVEGRITEYALQGATRSTPTRLIDAQMRRLLTDGPTRKARLERTLALLREIPGQTVQAQLRPAGEPGALALDLTVRRQQVELAINVNNRGVINVVEGAQAQVQVRLNGLVREGDATIATTYVPVHPDRYQFYTLSHSTPLGAEGTRLGFSGAYVRTRTRDTRILGEAKQFGVSIAHPVIRSNRRNLTASLSLDGTDSDNYYLDTAFGGFRTRALRAGLSWSDIAEKGGYSASLSVSRGLDALGARPFAGYSQPDYTKVNLQAAAVKQIAPAVLVKATLRAQYSDDLLPTTERFSLGGEGAGLAYRIGVALGERALAGGAELSWKVLGPMRDSRGLTVFAYGDAATAKSLARPVYNLPARDYSLASAGAGVRVAPTTKWTATAQLAFPIDTPYPGMRKVPRLFFSVSRTV